MEIQLPPDCGNAPKKLLLANWYKNLAEGNTDLLISYLVDDIYWTIIGVQQSLGKESILKSTIKLHFFKFKKLDIKAMITHGPEAAVHGEFISSNNKKYAFCDVFRFKSAGSKTIKSISSYIIEI